MSDRLAGAEPTALGCPPRSDRAGTGRLMACVLGLLAGLLYNSWLLAFMLNRGALSGTYISVLEMPGRPHADLFIACDLAAGALAIAAGLVLLRHPLVAVGLVMFGTGNVLDGLLPIEGPCAASVASCGVGLGQVLAPHTLGSILSSAGLVLALWSLRHHSRWMGAVTVLLALSALFLLASVLASQWVTVSQVSFLVASSVVLTAVPFAARRTSGSRD